MEEISIDDTSTVHVAVNLIYKKNSSLTLPNNTVCEIKAELLKEVCHDAKVTLKLESSCT